MVSDPVLRVTAIIWVVTPCSFAVGYRRFGALCCPHLYGEVHAIQVTLHLTVSLSWY
jgi:hypothetical protein